MISEAEVMSRFMLRCGVPREAILLEERSTTTMENLVFVKNKLDARQNTDYRCAIVTSDYHVFRTSLYASKAGFMATELVHALHNTISRLLSSVSSLQLRKNTGCPI